MKRELLLGFGLYLSACALLPVKVWAHDALTNDTQPATVKPSFTQDDFERIEWANALPEADLAFYRAGQTIVAGTQTFQAITSANALNGGYVAGAVSLSGNALSNFSGVGNFAINTGAQVSMQSGINLTINLGP